MIVNQSVREKRATLLLCYPVVLLTNLTVFIPLTAMQPTHVSVAKTVKSSSSC